jgi:hypothetical protein
VGEKSQEGTGEKEKLSSEYRVRSSEYGKAKAVIPGLTRNPACTQRLRVWSRECRVWLFFKTLDSRFRGNDEKKAKEVK